MKTNKLFMSLFLVLLAITSSIGQGYKPVAGDVDLELMFTPLGDSPIGLDYLKGRIFIEDDVAFRLGLNIDINSDKSEPVNEENKNVTDEVKRSSTTLGLWPGIEVHLGDFERVSPYVGVEVGFTNKGAKFEYTDNNANETTEIKGAWDSDGTNRGYTSFGLNLISGFDWYFVRKVYLGAELGFGFANTSWKEIKVTTGAETSTAKAKSRNTDIGFNVVSAIRLGYTF